MKNNHSFSIENATNPNTNSPFGSKYTGTFNIRRPSIGDKHSITIKKAATLSAYGFANLDMIPVGIQLNVYIFCFVATISKDLPPWFDPDKLYDENDQAAIETVWQEVSRWLDTFRPDADTSPREPTSRDFTVLVP